MFDPCSTETGPTVTIDFEGTRITVPAGITVAAAVMAYTGATHIRRSPVTRGPRTALWASVMNASCKSTAGPTSRPASSKCKTA